MEELRKCSTCGTETTADALEGLCQRCLLALCLRDEQAVECHVCHSPVTRDALPCACPSCGTEISPITFDLSSAPRLWTDAQEPIPGYQLIRILGRGGMGEVWEACGHGGIPVALKRVDLTTGCGERELQALKLLRSVRHPHLLSIQGYWIQEDLLVIAYELADESLHSLLSKLKNQGISGLAQNDVSRYLEDAAEALDYLARPIHRVNGHSIGIQHRDVKPANLLLQGGAVKVADFGLVKTLEEVVRPRSLTMSVPYAAPEFFRGHTTQTSDQYSLGVSYYELRTGRVPFPGSPEQMMDGHINREPKLEGLTEDERKVVERALAKDPKQRWAGCVKFMGELKRACDPVSLQPEGSDDQKNLARFRGQPVTTGLLLAGDELVPLPLRQTDVHAAISIAAAEVTVSQVFVNDHDLPLEATYVFPLPEDAAVHKLLMHVGERTIEGVVYEKEEARQTYEQAKQEGHGAALMEETTPNIFTISVANILPQQDVRIEISYLQQLPFQDSKYRFVFPMTISPRYLLGSDEAAIPMVSRVPSAIAAPHLPQGMLRGDAVSIKVDLDSGVPLCGFDSPSHDIRTIESEGGSRVAIELSHDDEIPNRDFVLNYRVSAQRIEHAMLFDAGNEAEPGTFSILTTPPIFSGGSTLPREMIFVLDRSGSMTGEPLAQAKRAVQQMIDRLSPEDQFNVIAFDNEVSPLFGSPSVAEESNLRRARVFLERIDARGGTEMLEPLRMALNDTNQNSGSRMVIFLTDGSVYGERELLDSLRPLIGQTRIVAFGAGTAVNRHLINKLASAARGFSEFIFPGENITHAVDRTLSRLSHPVLTDVELEWGSDCVYELIPEKCPDLYRDQPLVVLGRCRGEKLPQLTIRGRLEGQPYETTIDGEDVRDTKSCVPLAKLWARHRIEMLMDQMWEQPAQKDELRKQVIDLATQYNLASEYTSFLAVEYRTAADRAQSKGTISVEIPQYMPEGMWDRAGFLDQAIAATRQTKRSRVRHMLGSLVSKMVSEPEQKSFSDSLPDLPPKGSPKFADFQIFDHYSPSPKGNGDFHRYVILDQHRIAVLIGNVSHKKGAVASSFLARLCTKVKSLFQKGLSAAEVMTRANTQWWAQSVTMVVVVLDSSTNEVLLVNAGNEPPIMRRRDGSLEPIGGKCAGPLLGSDSGFEYEQHVAELNPGDCLVLVTDGILAACNTDNEQFGQPSLHATVKETNGTAPETGRTIIDRVTGFVGDHQQNSDICVVAVSRDRER